jgi:hypothetical protein
MYLSAFDIYLKQ